MCEPSDFYMRFFLTCWFDTEKALFQVILGLLLVYERGCMSKSVYIYIYITCIYMRVVHDIIIEICFSLCD